MFSRGADTTRKGRRKREGKDGNMARRPRGKEREEKRMGDRTRRP